LLKQFKKLHELSSPQSHVIDVWCDSYNLQTVLFACCLSEC